MAGVIEFTGANTNTHNRGVIANNVVDSIGGDQWFVDSDGPRFQGLVIEGNSLRDVNGVRLVTSGFGSIFATIANNHIDAASGGIEVEAPGGRVAIVDNVVGADNDGIVLTLSSSGTGVVQGNQVIGTGAVDNTYDAIRISGNGLKVSDNTVRPSGFADQARSAVNIASGDCNIVVGNDLDDPTSYATDALIDSGTNTQLTYPNDPTYGDNFTGCGTSA